MLEKLAFWRKPEPPRPTRRALNPLNVRDQINERRRQLESQVLADLKAGHLGDEVPFPDIEKLTVRPEGTQYWADHALGLPPSQFLAPRQSTEVKKPGFYAPVAPSPDDRKLLRQLQELGEDPNDLFG